MFKSIFSQASIINQGKKQVLLIVMLLSCLVILFSGCAQQINKETQNVSKTSGLLLGIKSKNAENKPQYKTLYITNNNGNISLVTQGSGILVPRDDGFWSVNVETEKQTDNYKGISYESSLDYISVKKVDREPVKENNEEKYQPGELVKRYYDPVVHYDGMKFFENKNIDLIYAGNNYVSQKVESSGYLGGAHGYATNSLGTMEISKTKDRSDYIAISTLLGKEAKAELFKQGKAYYEKHQNEGIDSEVRSEKDWGLFRQNGKWVVKGFLGFNSQADRGAYAIFNTGLIPPLELVGHDVLMPKWEVIKSFLPEAKDAFSSPKGDVLVVLTPHKIRVYTDFQEDYIGEATYIIDLEDIFTSEEKNEIDVIMVQWAIGDYVEKWAVELKNNLEENNSSEITGEEVGEKNNFEQEVVCENPFNASQVNNGDKVCGLILKEKRTDKNNEVYQLDFSGEVKISGTYEHSGPHGPMTPCIAFYPDSNSLRLLPKTKDDTRPVWFRLNDYYRIKDNFGVIDSSGKASILINNYIIDLREAATSNTADLVKIVDLESSSVEDTIAEDFHKHTGEKVIKVFYDDFDGDGSKEAFILTGELEKGSWRWLEGKVWFAGETYEMVQDGLFTDSFFEPSIITSGQTKMLNVKKEDGIDCYSLMFGVVGGEPQTYFDY